MNNSSKFRTTKFLPLRPDMENKKPIIKKMNELAQKGEPFAFLIDFLGENPQFFSVNDYDKILWDIPISRNCKVRKKVKNPRRWETKAVNFAHYKKGFDQILQHINNGDTYLLNYTQPTFVDTDLSLTDIFYLSNAPYRILLKNHFVCFSPEPFVKIENGKIYSFPMKGTIDADLENAREKILSDSKEVAEHNTIVDLIRNDLSIIADNVEVEEFRYINKIQTNQRNLLQVSSRISGDLPADYTKNIGEIIVNMLPAGSVSGAPKKKTVEIINANENYNRGYYTGVFGVFDGKNLDSCVLIRFIEKQENKLIYKSGGGITFLSDAEKEYDEMIKKIYVPVFKGNEGDL